MEKINEITIEKILQAFNECNSETEVIKYFDRKPNGSSWRFVGKLKQKANIGNNFFQNKITKEEYLKHPKHCEECGCELTFKQRFNKFCSSSCSTKHNNVIRGKHSIETRKKISDAIRAKHPDKKYEEFTIEKKTNVTEDKISGWLQGENFTRGATQVPSFIKNYLMKLHDNKCEKCGWGETNEVTGKIPLEIHHIDGDCTNNKIENLQLLCPNCHSLTSNFGSLNKNSNRFHRSKKTLND